MKPDSLNLSQVDSNLHISWQAKVSKFKPIDKFLVLITKIDAAQHSISRRRQTHQLYEEHETTHTFYTMAITKKTLYLIQICAANGNHRNCSKVLVFSTDPDIVKAYTFSSHTPSSHTTGYPVFDNPIPVGLEKGGNGRNNEDNLGRMGVIAVIIGLAVAFTLAILLIITVLVCKCWGERRHYYPSHQGMQGEVLGKRGNWS